MKALFIAISLFFSIGIHAKDLLTRDLLDLAATTGKLDKLQFFLNKTLVMEQPENSSRSADIINGRLSITTTNIDHKIITISNKMAGKILGSASGVTKDFRNYSALFIAFDPKCQSVACALEFRNVEYPVTHPLFYRTKGYFLNEITGTSFSSKIGFKNEWFLTINLL